MSRTREVLLLVMALEVLVGLLLIRSVIPGHSVYLDERKPPDPPCQGCGCMDPHGVIRRCQEIEWEEKK